MNDDAKGSPRLSFEQALARLEQLVAAIEQGKVSLEESIDKYAEGVELVKQCRAILDRAEKKIQLLGRGGDGQLEVTGEMDEPCDEDG